MKQALLKTVGLAALTAMGLSACSSPPPASESPSSAPVVPVELNLVGYAVPQTANNALQALWAHTPDGAGVTWVESYGASGDQSRAVVAGLKADYVHFSLEADVTRLVKEGLVAKDWNQNATKGIVSSSVVVIAVRPGNPLGIHSWADLAKDGVKIVTPNPGSSGSARWNILAAWGSVVAGGGSEEDATAFVTKLFKNVVALPGSGRDATTAFLSGTGDVLLSYENETILARQNGAAIDYIVPDTTLRIDNPGAVLVGANPKAQLWLDYVVSPVGQAEFAKFGFRPVISGVQVGEVKGANDPSHPFPVPRTLLNINDDFGGWPAANTKFFDADKGIITKIQAASGKS
jgi:sulfate/thiosulfate-binding protein